MTRTKDTSGVESVGMDEVIQKAVEAVMPDVEEEVYDAVEQAFGKFLEDDDEVEESEDELEEEDEELDDEDDEETEEDDDADDDDEPEDDDEDEDDEDDEDEDEENDEDEEDDDDDDDEDESEKSVDVDDIVNRISKKLEKSVERAVAKRFDELEVVRTGGKRGHLVAKGGERKSGSGSDDGFDFTKVESSSDIPDEELFSLDEDELAEVCKRLEKGIRRDILARWIHRTSGHPSD